MDTSYRICYNDGPLATHFAGCQASTSTFAAICRWPRFPPAWKEIKPILHWRPVLCKVGSSRGSGKKMKHFVFSKNMFFFPLSCFFAGNPWPCILVDRLLKCLSYIGIYYVIVMYLPFCWLGAQFLLKYLFGRLGTLLIASYTWGKGRLWPKQCSRLLWL